MRRIVLFLSMLPVAILSHAQQDIFKKHGHSKEAFTLSKGKYQETFPNEEIVQIGTVLINTNTGKIIEFLEEDTTMFAYKAETSSRFLTIDPLAEKYYNWSPYVYVTNNPMKYIDPTGMWKKDTNGNLVAEDKDTDETLAKYLNTTKEIAISMMLEQKFSTNKEGDIIMGTGDIFEVGNDRYGDKVGGYGGEIQSRAGSQFSKDMFWNYWNGKGDVEIKGQRFASILMYLKENKSVPTDLDGKSNKITGKVVSFYDSEEYALVFGRATVYYDPKGHVVGFFDNYDFDSKSFGTRTTSNEIKTRLVNIFSPSSSKPFNIRYGKSK